MPIKFCLPVEVFSGEVLHIKICMASSLSKLIYPLFHTYISILNATYLVTLLPYYLFLHYLCKKGIGIVKTMEHYISVCLASFSQISRRKVVTREKLLMLMLCACGSSPGQLISPTASSVMTAADVPIFSTLHVEKICEDKRYLS
jgi:hypothetical protein